MKLKKSVWIPFFTTVMWAVIGSVIGSPAFGETFSIVVIPDTQNYSAARPETFKAQTRWIAANRDALNIIYVAHLGDIVNAYNDNAQWSSADAAMAGLESLSATGLAEGIPYGIIPGGPPHDQGPGGDTSVYNSRFGTARFSGRGYYGGTFTPGNNDNNYILFSSCGMDFIAVNLNSADTVGPAQTAVIEWADSLLKTYSDRRAIITSHYLLEYADVSPQDGKPDLGTYGQAIFDGLKDNPNLFMMLCGHRHGEASRIEANDAGGPVYILLSDYQDRDGGDSGYLRVMRFDTSNDRITVSTYSPTLNRYGADAIQGENTASADFTLDYDMATCPGTVLLFDTSGSMSWDVDNNMEVDEEEQRLTLAKNAAEAFVQVLDDYTGKSRIGVAAFPQQSLEGCNGETLKVLGSSTGEGGGADITAIIKGLKPGGATPMLAGLKTASAMFSSEDTKAVVLLSDGYHNCPSDLEAGSPEFETMIGNLKGVTVHTIGFPWAGDGRFLDELAVRTSGSFRDVTASGSRVSTPDPGRPEGGATGTDQVKLTGAYAETLADIIGLDKITGPLAAIGKGETNTHEIALSRYDRKVTFLLSWHTTEEERLELRLISSDNQVVDLEAEGVTCRNGSTYKIISIEDEFLKAPGKVGAEAWKMEVTARGLGRHEIEPYQYTVVTKSALNMEASLDRGRYRTGNVVTLTAKLSLAGRPLLNEEGLSVQVTRPADGAGNWFAQNKVTAEQLDEVPSQVEKEVLSDLQRKAIHIQDTLKIVPPGNAAPVKLRLYDNGTNGDAVAGDGVYTNQFFETVKEGVYSFCFQAKGMLGDDGTFTREKVIQRYVTVNASPEHLTMEAMYAGDGDEGERYKITITPKDVFGNYLGPGYSKAIDITPSVWTLMGPVTDNLDGTYTRMVELPEEVSHKGLDIKVSINGTEITRPFPTPTEQPEGRNYLLWTVMILFIIACFIVSAVNKAGKKADSWRTWPGALQFVQGLVLRIGDNRGLQKVVLKIKTYVRKT